jgi:pimeloyl-ACP methyl ester carboxylesterase
LNLTTYYKMKGRAGDVGLRGVAQLLDTLATVRPNVRRHLAGHSFGARVVSAAATRHKPIHSITLLQGAFSHYGFAAAYDAETRPGFFRSVLDRHHHAGPLLITHTANDRAVGLAYAIASRLANQAGSQLGGPDDRYGGVGRNGAQKPGSRVPAPTRTRSATDTPSPPDRCTTSGPTTSSPRTAT